MTKVMMNLGEDGSIFFDCENHSDDYNVCTIISTICNVLVACIEQHEFRPEAYEPGHVRIYIPMKNKSLISVFKAARNVIEQVVEQHPGMIKLY